MWIWISVITLLLSIIIFFSWVIYRLVDQTEQYESDIEWFEDWYGKFIETVAEAEVRMNEVDKKGSFSSDDEIGFAYETIKECINNLTQMGAITYDGQEERQTDSPEEIQGQEKEE